MSLLQAPSVKDRSVESAFAIAMTAIAILSVFGHRGVAPCVGLMAFAVATRAEIWRDGLRLLSPRRLIGDPLAAAAGSIFCLSLWIAITARWSPTPGGEWLGLTVLAGALCAGALVYEPLTAAPRRLSRMAFGFAVMVVVACAALFFEGVSGGYLREIAPPEDQSPGHVKDLVALGRGATAIAPLVFPAAVIIRRTTLSWAVSLAPAAALMIGAMKFSIFANVAALGAGLVIFAFSLVSPRASIKLIAASFLAALAFAPIVAAALPAEGVIGGDFDWLPASWAQRIVVWKEAGEMVLRDCMPLGCGADYSRALAASGKMIAIPHWPLELQAMPTHPHNVFLQVWLELGLPGVAFLGAAAAAGTLAFLRARMDSTVLAAACAAVSVCFISVMFEASIWQAWRLAVYALAAFGVTVANSVLRRS